MFDMSKIPYIPKACDAFKKRHCGVMDFLHEFTKYPIKEGAIVSVSVKNPDGSVIRTNMKVTKEDLDMYHTFMK